MNTATRRIVASLSDRERLQIIAEYRSLEKNGSIGDCLLRITAEKVADCFGGGGGGPLWMESVANACFRYYAELYINSMDDLK